MNAVGTVHAVVPAFAPPLGSAPDAIGRMHHTLHFQNGGLLRITGTVKNTGLPANTPVYRRVRLHEQRSGRVIQETWSDPVTGAYSFDFLATGTYYVTGFDHTGQYSGVIETDVTPEVPA